ncbi:MAG TPA: ATP-binding cassette domain-containing protein [Aquihabitans sp.]|jgi:ABC-2 type transport system ATP-binding protein|nr:ATP-binding cassette domain-containing protein [Aquihabitans sp.]
MTSPHAIEARGLVKRFGEKTALGGVDVAVPVGTVTAVLGPNGAGKTTAVRILTTLSRADEGTATVAGFDVAQQPTEVRRRIGLAAQDATVDPLLTGHENLVMIGELHQLPRREAKARATELLAQFDLVDAGSKVASAFSGGMRRRLDLAATLVARPEVLFLDEPTTGLDPRARNDLWAVLETLLDEGVTILLTTQYLEEADRLADDILVIDRGTVIARGDARSLKREVGGDNIGITLADQARLDDVAEILGRVTGSAPVVDRPNRTATAPTTGGVAGLAAVANALAEAGHEVEDLSLRQPTLDEVFLTLTGLPMDAGEEPDTERTPQEVAP